MVSPVQVREEGAWKEGELRVDAAATEIARECLS